MKRGTDYELKGEKGAYIIDGSGSLIIRSRTAVIAEPLNNRSYNNGVRYTGVNADGEIRFRLELRNPDGTLAADSQEETVRYRVDDRVPIPVVRAGGAAASGGALFSSSSAFFSITCPEDEGSGLESVRYRILSAPSGGGTGSGTTNGFRELSETGSWKETPPKSRITLSGEGIYAVEVEARDAVGNISQARSDTVIIDSTKPQIRIEGVEDGSANSSDFRVRAQCQDPYYLPGSLNAEIQADFGGVKPASGLREDDKGAVLTFDSFPRRKGADAIYHLSVTAKDRAGNVSKKQISFSVNRYGSSYSLSDETARELKQYYHRKPFAVTFIETNLDQVGSARVLLRSGDSLTELGAGSGLEVSESRTSNGASRYSYTVPASCFSKDGIYEVMLLTSDRAGNSSDSAATASFKSSLGASSALSGMDSTGVCRMRWRWMFRHSLMTIRVK